jgi:hypothetical protein
VYRLVDDKIHFKSEEFAMSGMLRCVATVAVAGFVAFAPCLIAEETAVPLDKLPDKVTAAVKKMFPKGDLLKATLETEGDETEYEVELRDAGKSVTVTVEKNGEIEAFERQIDLKELPRFVTEALEKKYPKSVLKSAEELYEIEDGDAEFEGYEIQLETADKKMIEVTIEVELTIKVE